MPTSEETGETASLIRAVRRYRARLVRAREALRDHRAELAERAKESRCLRDVTAALIETDGGIANSLRRIADLIPSGMQRPDLSWARVEVYGRETTTANVRRGGETLRAPIEADGRDVGFVEVGYVAPWWPDGRPAFLPEETNLVRSIADAIGESLVRRHAEASLKALIENVRDVILVLASDGTIRSISPAIRRIAGFEPEEMIGRPAWDFVHPEDRAAVMAIHEQAVRIPGMVAAVEFRGLRRDGSWWHAETMGQNLLAGPSVHGVLIAARDVTARKRAERAEQALREVDRRIVQGEPVASILRYACEPLADMHNQSLVAIAVPDSDGALRVGGAAGPAADRISPNAIAWDPRRDRRVPAVRALLTGTSVVARVSTRARREPDASLAKSDGVRSVLAVPLALANAEPFAVLLCYETRATAADAESRSDLERFANQLALSVLHARQQERIRLQTAAVEAAAHAIVITDVQGRILSVNPAFTAITGYAAAEAIGRKPSLLKSGIQSEDLYRTLWRTILSGRPWTGEIHNRRKDGGIYIARQAITPVRDARGEITHFVAIQQDVTEQKRQEEHIRYLATHDPLTGLPNRAMLEDGLERLLRRAVAGRRSAFMLLNLDNFKAINDTVGHAAGDGYLVQLSRVLRDALRPGDFLARFGGDEFAVLLEDVSIETARRVAERVRQKVAAFRFHHDGLTFAPTVTVGIAPVNGSADQGATILALADAALHQAKDRGRNRVAVYEALTEREHVLAAGSQWAVRIQDALRDDRLYLRFQPIVPLRNGHRPLLEALLGMRGDDGGSILPATFLPAAERFVLMPQLDEWVVARVLGLLARRNAASWRRSPGSRTRSASA